MNYEWAIKLVREFVKLLEDDEWLWRNKIPSATTDGGRGPTIDRAEIGRDVDQRLSTVLKIAERVEPGLVRNFMLEDGGGDWRYKTRLQVSRVLLGALEDADEVDKNLGPVGPRLAAVELHPWVLDAARSLWDDGYRRQALAAAAHQVELHLQAKTDLPSKSGKDLAQAFSADSPTATMPRLRLPGFTPGTDNFNSVQEGTKFLCMAVFQRVRNLAVHYAVEPPEDAALEATAMISLLARSVDEATLETV